MNLNKEITTLDLDKNIIVILRENNILIIEDLWKLKRLDLRSMGITDSEINQIIVKLQLLGIGLNRKIYNNDRLKV